MVPLGLIRRSHNDTLLLSASSTHFREIADVAARRGRPKMFVPGCGCARRLVTTTNVAKADRLEKLIHETDQHAISRKFRSVTTAVGYSLVAYKLIRN